jgi:Sushi repeat (SCR repeat)
MENVLVSSYAKYVLQSYFLWCFFVFIFPEFPQKEAYKGFAVCPQIFSPTHGYLECSRPIDAMKIQGRIKITNLPGTECTLICPEKYKMFGKFKKTCGTDGKWLGEDDGYCSSVYFERHYSASIQYQILMKQIWKQTRIIKILFFSFQKLYKTLNAQKL